MTDLEFTNEDLQILNDLDSWYTDETDKNYGGEI